MGHSSICIPKNFYLINLLATICLMRNGISSEERLSTECATQHNSIWAAKLTRQSTVMICPALRSTPVFSGRGVQAWPSRP